MNKEADHASFLSGVNSAFIEQLYERYLTRPETVDASWRNFFADLGDELPNVAAEARGASWAPPCEPLPVEGEAETKADGNAAKPGAKAGLAEKDVRAATLDSIRALMLIRAFRVRGHLIAKLDPLELEAREYHPELDPANYGFGEDDMDRPIFIDNVLGLETASIREIAAVLRQTYGGTIGYEFMHIQHPDQKAWIQERIEGHQYKPAFTGEGRVKILQQLTHAEGFERFLHVKYTGTKRFGADGAEALIPLLEAINKRSAQLGVREIVIGMPHRGRLNVLVNIMAKPYRALFSEFQGESPNPEEVQGSGDVKYHMGTSADRDFDGHELHLSLSANPSHLEAVDPVVIGKTRAKQNQYGDTKDRNTVLAVLMHGDAAFAGQGVIGEVFGLSDLSGYRTGGTIHVIVNNQIGFTTAPKFSRSTPYPSGVAKGGQSPIFHVNGDEPESVVHVARLAAEFRQEFGRDVVIDMFCYRRFGHNEGDEPGFTQPKMYGKIKDHPPVRQIYAHKLVNAGLIEQEAADAMASDFHAALGKDFDASTSYKPNKADWLEGAWHGLRVAEGGARRGKTAVKIRILKDIGKALMSVPESHDVHRTIQRQLTNKQKIFESGERLDWATGEALAFGSLMLDGYGVRLSGQDSQRGTFSHRHAVLIDQTTEETYTPLANIGGAQASFEVVDSSLSEMGVLGFEYGYSQAEPNALVLWEAQFGDFANGAQIIIDQFIASGESKWLRMSGLVMLLPHGYEGQGPEHSSARLERFLQLCAEDNLQVANCTTPASYFHILRRQMHRDFRKPLIVMAPKSLLRHKRVVSKLADLGPGTSFHRVLWDDCETHADARIKRVILCSGKVYYDLWEEREKRGIKDIKVLRLEQLYPFPKQPLIEELGRVKKAEIMWCQDEPQNQGAWTFVAPRIENVLKKIGRAGDRPRYAGRIEYASTATGLLRTHLKEQAALMDAALTL